MVTFGSRLFSLAAAALLFGLAEPAWSQEVFNGNDNNNDDPRQQSGLPGPGDDNGLVLRRPRGLHYCPRDHGYYRDSRTCGRLEGQDLQPPPAMADDAALVSTCGTILQQNGNFRNSLSCKSGRVTGFCEQFGASDPECPAIIAQLRREVPNLGGLSYDGARPISPCRHDPRSASCQGGGRSPVRHSGGEPLPGGASKNLTRGPKRMPEMDPPPASLSQIINGVDDCFTKADPRYRPPDWSNFILDHSVGFGLNGRYNTTIDAINLADERLIQTFPLRRGLSMDHDIAQGELAGWIFHCLGSHKIMPILDSSLEYELYVVNYERHRGSKRSEQLWRAFDSGYNHYPQIYPLSDPASMYTEPGSLGH